VVLRLDISEILVNAASQPLECIVSRRGCLYESTN
jgi:hypothetical protein